MNDQDTIEDGLQQAVDQVKRQRGRLKAELSLKDSDIAVLRDRARRAESELAQERDRRLGLERVLDELVEVLQRARDARAEPPAPRQVAREAVRGEFAEGERTAGDVRRALHTIAGDGAPPEA